MPKYSMRLCDIFEVDALVLPAIEVRDTVYVGKFKNRKATIAGFSTDDHNQPVLRTNKGDTKLFKPRIAKLDELTRTDRAPGLISAIRHRGKVYRGRTHLDALDRIDDPAERRAATLDGDNRGYVTSTGRFLTRRQGLKYALDHDLIADRYKAWFQPGRPGELPSEALRADAMIGD